MITQIGKTAQELDQYATLCPEFHLHLYLRDKELYPGNILFGAVRFSLPAATYLHTLAIKLEGRETSHVCEHLVRTFCSMLSTTYYRQYFTLVPDLYCLDARMCHLRVETSPASSPNLASPPSHPGHECSGSEKQRQSISDSTGVKRRLKSGVYTLPFTIPLPVTLPPSFALTNGSNFARLFYTIKVQIRDAQNRKSTALKLLTILPAPVPLYPWLRAHGTTYINSSSNYDANSNVEVEPKNDDDTPRYYLNHRLMLSNDLPEPRDWERSNTGGLPNSMSVAEDPCQNFNRAECKRSTDESATASDTENGTLDSTSNFPGPVPRRTGGTVGFAADVSKSAGCLDERTGAAYVAADAVDGENDFKQNLCLSARHSISSVNCTLSVPVGLGMRNKVNIDCALPNIVLVPGKSVLCFSVTLNNSAGITSIDKVRCSLVAHHTIQDRANKHKWTKTLIKRTLTDRIPTGKVARMLDVKLDVPEHTPLTISTRGLRTGTFLKLSVCSNRLLKTFSKSVEMEVLIVRSIDFTKTIQHLWKNDFREDKSIGRGACSAPDEHLGDSIFSSMRLIESFSLSPKEVTQCAMPKLYTITFAPPHNVEFVSSSSPTETSRCMDLSDSYASRQHPRKEDGKINFEHATYEPFPQTRKFADPTVVLNPLAIRTDCGAA